MTSAVINRTINDQRLQGGLFLAALAAFALAVNQPLLLFAGMVLVIGGFVSVQATPKFALQFYLIYLLFEGAAKIWTNYNVVTRVGADLVLLAVFTKIWIKARAEGYHGHRVIAERVVPFLILFWMWCLVQFFNPWGLGILPSIAAAKIYVVPTLLFFLVAFMMKPEDTKQLPLLILGIGLFQAVLTLIDASQGMAGVPSLHPRYYVALSPQFIGNQYRPFGTTALPGGPAAWMVHCTVAVMFSLYHALKELPPGWLRRTILTAVTVYIPLAITTLFVCQVRSAMVKFFFILLTGLVLLGGRRLLKVGAFGVLLAGLLFTVGSQIEIAGMSGIDEERLALTTDRFSTLSSGHEWSRARGGALDASLDLANHTMMGIGLSRVGAASAPWIQRINRDHHFGTEWSFADNLFKAVFTEVGLFGLLAFLLMHLVIIVTLFRKGGYYSNLVGAYCCLYLISGYASEGVLYLPSAAFFWLYVGWALSRPRPEEQTQVAASEAQLEVAR